MGARLFTIASQTGRACAVHGLPFSKQVFRGPRVHFRVDIPRATSHEHRMTATAPLIPENCGSGKRRAGGERKQILLEKL